MPGSTWGNYFRVTTWGESHGKGVGVVVDGCPAGLKLVERDIQLELNRRRPGQSIFSSPRKENDKVEILSGVFEDVTTGTPIAMMVQNTDQRPRDYSNIKEVYRPGHADFAFDAKYGFRDYRGGGRSSARETIARVAAGAIAKKILGEMGITILGYTRSVGPIEVDMENFDASEIEKNHFRMPDAEMAEEATALLHEIIKEGNSIGGMVECIVDGVPAGLGEPVFDKMDANLAKAIMSIGAVKSVEIGAGAETAKRKGYDNNDFYRMEDGHVTKLSNHAGGITGGITDGSQIVLRCAVKPTASIHIDQPSINKSGDNISMMIEGRHDPVIVPRAVPIVEAMTALTVIDLLFANMTSTMDNVKKVYHV